MKHVSTRIIHKHALEADWLKATNFAPLQGELIIYDIEVDENGQAIKIPDGNGGEIEAYRAAAQDPSRTAYKDRPYTYERFKIGDGKTNVTDLPFAGGTDENSVKLAEDLYTYTAIGKISSASNTSPVKVASAGDTLKTVFNKVFGTQQDTQPTITTSNVKLNVSAGTTSYGGGEYGTAVSAATVNITFELKNSGTAQYGYRCGNTKTTTSDATFYYPVAKQNNADIKITLPFTISKVEDTTVDSVAYKKLTTVNGANKTITILTPSATYVSYSTKYLYCNFNSSKQVSIKLNLPSGSVTTSQQTRYEQISASVTLGVAQIENQLTAGTAITEFLTFLKNDATETGKSSGGTKSGTAGAYTIKAGSKYVYWATTSSTTAPTATAWTLYDPDQDGIGQTGVVDLQLSCNANEYIWVASTGNYSNLYMFNDVSGKYNSDPMATTKTSGAEITNAQGAKATGYYTYRTTNPMSLATNTKFKLV